MFKSKNITKPMRKLIISKELTNRDQISVNKYFSDICGYDLLDSSDEIKLTRRIREGDEHALKTLVISNLRFVVSVAKKYQHQGLPLADLINEGNLGLIEAAKRFDETRGFKFITYAVWWIRQSMIKAITEHSRIVRLPANRIQTMNKINGAISRLQQELDRDPDESEISAQINAKDASTSETMDIMNAHISLDAPADQNNETTMSDFIHNDQSPRPDKGLENCSVKYEIKRALRNLNKKEAEVIRLHYGLDSGLPMSLQSIGHRFSLSEERVRQIRSNAIKKLRDPLIARPFQKSIAV